MMFYDGFSVNRCLEKHAQRFEIISILMQASMIIEIVQINRLQHHSKWDFLLVIGTLVWTSIV